MLFSMPVSYRLYIVWLLLHLVKSHSTFRTSSNKIPVNLPQQGHSTGSYTRTLFHISRSLPLVLRSFTFTHSKDICWTTFTYHMSHTLCRGLGYKPKQDRQGLSSLTAVPQQGYRLHNKYSKKCLITIVVSVIKDLGALTCINRNQT